MNRMQSIGTKFCVYFTRLRRPCSFMRKSEGLDMSMAVLTNATRRYTQKNWVQRLTVHATAGLTGMSGAGAVTSVTVPLDQVMLEVTISFGPSIRYMPTQTAAKPPYRQVMATYLTTESTKTVTPPPTMAEVSKFPSLSVLTCVSPVKK